MPDQYERDPYYKLIYDTEGPPPLVNLSLDGVDPVDVSKQQPPSPNPPLLPVVGKEVSKRRYLVDDAAETTLKPRWPYRSLTQSRFEEMACPFGKLRPEKHTSCSSKTFRGVSHLKEHLFRCHIPEYYCQDCLRVFQTATEHVEHFTGEPVCKLTRVEPDFLTRSQFLQLRQPLPLARSRPLAEAWWYRVWDVCFPGRERPVSIYVEDKHALATALPSYRDFVSLQGPQILGDVLSKSGYNGPGTRDGLLKILQNGLDLISSRWAAIRDERAPVDREPPTIESSSSTSTWSGSALPAADAPDSPSSYDFIFGLLPACDGEEAEWSPEEDSLLVELKGIGTAGEEISAYLLGRSNHSCHRRYLDLHAKWSEELKMKLLDLRTTKRYTEESEPRSNTCEQDPETTVNPAQVPLNPDTNPEGCLSVTQVATSIATSTPASDDMYTLSRDDSQSQNHLDGSDKSEYFMFDEAALYDSSRFSVLESAVADQLLDAYDKWSRISTFCKTSCTASEPIDTSEASQTPNASSEPNASPPSSSSSAGISVSVAASTLQAFPKGRATQKRRRRKDSDSDDEDQPKNPRVQRRKRVEEGEKRLACPFQKRYHPGHLFCGEDRATRGFQTIAQVKQHITRSHLHPPFHCTRCKTKFDDVSEMDTHKNATPPCEELPYFDETKLLWNMKLVKAINARVNEKINLDKQWFSVWDLLFPDAKHPASCRVESDELCKHLLGFQQFVVDEGGSIIEEILREDDLSLEAESGQGLEEIERRKEERKMFGVRVLNLAAKKFIEGRAPPRGPHVAQYMGHISSTNRGDREMTDPPVGSATLPQAPLGIHAPNEADARPETVPGGDISQGEDGTIHAVGRATSPAEAGRLAFSIFDIYSFDNMMWDTNVTSQLDPGPFESWTG